MDDHGDWCLASPILLGDHIFRRGRTSWRTNQLGYGVRCHRTERRSPLPMVLCNTFLVLVLFWQTQCSEDCRNHWRHPSNSFWTHLVLASFRRSWSVYLVGRNVWNRNGPRGLVLGTIRPGSPVDRAFSTGIVLGPILDIPWNTRS